MNSINLLPKEVVAARQKNNAAQTINRLCVFAIVGLVALSAVLLAARLAQSLQLTKSSELLSSVEARVNSLSDRQTQLNLIREYLKSIDSFSSSDSKKKAVFNLVAFIAPPDVSFNDISISKDGSTVISASSSSLLAIEKLITDLSSPERSSELISKIELEGLTLGKDSIYRFGLKVSLK